MCSSICSWPKQIIWLCSPPRPPRLILSLSRLRAGVMVGAPDSAGNAGAQCHTLAGSSWLLMAGMCLWGPPDSGYCGWPPLILRPSSPSSSPYRYHWIIHFPPHSLKSFRLHNLSFGRNGTVLGESKSLGASVTAESTVTRRHHNFGRKEASPARVSSTECFSVTGVGIESLHHVSVLYFCCCCCCCVC